MTKLTPQEQLALLPISFLIVMFLAIVAGGHPDYDPTPPAQTPSSSVVTNNGDELPMPGSGNNGDELPNQP